MTSIHELHARALDEQDRVISLVRETDLNRATPCSDWNLRALLEHLIGQNAGLARSLSGAEPDLDSWRPQELGSEGVAPVLRSTARLRAAISDPASGADEVWMPEITAAQPFPREQVIAFHFVDTVAHSWDVAMSIGVATAFDDEVLATARRIAEAIPDGPERGQAGAAFAPAVSSPDDSDSLSGTVALLGRDPRWGARTDRPSM